MLDTREKEEGEEAPEERQNAIRLYIQAITCGVQQSFCGTTQWGIRNLYNFVMYMFIIAWCI